MTPHIKTDRLVLRPIEIADANALFALINNVKVAKWLTPVPWPYLRSDAEDFVNRVTSQGVDVYYAICRDNVFMGCISYGAQLGYWLGEPFWGHGYMSEAANAVLSDYFTEDHPSSISGYHLENVVSRRVLEKLGFQETEVIQATSNVMGAVNIQRMILERSRWEGRTS